MVDIPGVLSASGILAGDIPNNLELQRRRAIATALAARQRKMPTTFGEGLTYLGESIGEGMENRRLNEMEAAQLKAGAAIRNDPRSTAAPPPAAAAPAAAPPVAAPVAAAPAESPEGTFMGGPYTPAAVRPVTEDDRRAPARLPAGLATDPNLIGAGADASDPAAQRERIARLLNPPPEVAGMVDPTQAPAPVGGRLASLEPLATLSDAPPIGGPGSQLALSKIAPAYAPTEPPTGLTPRPMPAVPAEENPPTPTTIQPMPVPMAQAPTGLIPGSVAGVPGMPAGPAGAPPGAAPGAATGPFALPPELRPTPTQPAYRDPGAEPKPPGETKTMIFNRHMAADPRVDPDTRAEMQRRYDREKEAQDGAFQRAYGLWKDRTVKKEEAEYTDPTRRSALEAQNLANQKIIRELVGEGFTVMTPEEAARFYPGTKPPPGQAIWRDRTGKPHFGPIPPATTTVNIDQKMETEEAKTTGKAAGEALGEMRAGARKAGGQLISLARAEAMLNQIETGMLEPTKMTFGQFARAIGIPDETLTKFGLDPKNFGTQQAFQGIVNDLTIGRLGSGGFPSAQFSNTDLKFLQGTMPGLGDDPQSNRIKIEAARLMARRDLEKAQEYAAWKSNPDNKSKSFFDFEDAFNARVSKADIMGDLQRQAEDLIARSRTKAAPPPAAGAPLPPEERARGMRWLQLNPGHEDAPAMKRLLGIP